MLKKILIGIVVMIIVCFGGYDIYTRIQKSHEPELVFVDKDLRTVAEDNFNPYYYVIKAEDYHFEYLSHSNGQPENEDDPFLYAEKHMPTYVGLDCTVNSSEPHKVFPTRAMIRELLLEENKRISEALGIERSIDL